MERKLIELYRMLSDGKSYLFDTRLPFSADGKKSAVVKMGGDTAVFIDTAKIESISEETELVAHECGHIETGTTHRVCSPQDLIEKHEYKANKWAIHKIIPKEELTQAFSVGCEEPWEIAEYLGRSEGFVRKAIEIYQAEGIDFSSEMCAEFFPSDFRNAFATTAYGGAWS